MTEPLDIKGFDVEGTDGGIGKIRTRPYDESTRDAPKSEQILGRTTRRYLTELSKRLTRIGRPF